MIPVRAERSAVALASAERQRDNLLARIFRDGGQKQSAFATVSEACEAADSLCADYIYRATFFESRADAATEALASANAAREEAERERKAVEDLRVMQLAAIMTVSFQNTRATVADRTSNDNPYWTQAYGDVCVAIDREIRQRERADELAGELRGQEARGDAARELYAAMKERAEQSESRLKAAEAALRETERDAKRYRWLCSMAWGVPLGDGLHDLTFRTFLIEGPWLDTKPVADRAIDALLLPALPHTEGKKE